MKRGDVFLRLREKENLRRNKWRQHAQAKNDTTENEATSRKKREKEKEDNKLDPP